MKKEQLKQVITEIIFEQINEILSDTLLFHSTNFDNAIKILKDGEIKTYENILKSVNENPLDWYDDPEYGKYVYFSDFMHNDNNFYGLADLDVTFVVDSKKIKHKMNKADKKYEGGTVSVQGNVPLSAIKYVVLHKNNMNLVSLLKEKNIDFEIK